MLRASHALLRCALIPFSFPSWNCFLQDGFWVAERESSDDVAGMRPAGCTAPFAGDQSRGPPFARGPGEVATRLALAGTIFSVTAAAIIPCKSSGATCVALSGKAPRMLCCRRPEDGWQNELK